MKLDKKTIEIDSLIRSINKLLNNFTKNQLSRSELTLPRFHTLWIISKLEPVNMSKLNESIMVSNSTLTVTVDHLVEKGFVERYRDKKDRRVVLLRSTARGEKKLQDVLNDRQNFFQKALKNISLEEQNKLINLLDNIMSNLKIKYNNINSGSG